MPFDRRNFFRSLSLSGLGLPLLRSSAQAQSPKSKRPPKNIIFMVSDGMSAGVIAMAEIAAQRASKRATNWATLLRDANVARGLWDQASLSGPVTDSAAASSSWGCGSRVKNGALNTLPDGRLLTPIGKLVKDKGLRLGLVTTTSIWDATPAGFAAAVPNRSQRDDIAVQFLNRVDVLMGGGREAFVATRRRDQRDLWKDYEAAGYKSATEKAALGGVQAGDKLIALFGEGSLPYSIDHMRDAALVSRIPTVAEMTATALKALESSPKGFLLQVEGARIDHSAHANDAAAIVRDQLAFDAAIGVALEFARRRGDTLVVLGTDHGNSNPGLNSMSGRNGDTNECFDRLLKATASFESLARQLATRANVESVTQAVRASHSVELAPVQAQAIADSIAGKKGIVLSGQQDSPLGVMGQVMANYLGVGFCGTSHTADFATSTAVGPGQEEFEGLMRNTDVFAKLTKLLGISYRNPSADEASSAWNLGEPVEHAIAD